MVLLRRVSPKAHVGLAAALLTLIGAGGAQSQPAAGGLTVEPVGAVFANGRMTTTLRIVNNTGREIGFQVRPFAWSQAAGADQLTRTDVLAVSPPIGRIPTGGNQVVRLVLRRPPQGQEAAYRIMFDQVPPPPQPGAVNFAFRLSIPVFAEPVTARVAPRVSWRLQPEGGAYYLVAVNSGGRHGEFRNIALVSGGRTIAVDPRGSPYVLPGATRRWRILPAGFTPSGQLRVTARSVSGPVDEPLAGP